MKHGILKETAFLPYKKPTKFKLSLLALSIILFSLFFSPLKGLAEECSWCVIDYCRTTYPTLNDGDGDGMNDDYELQIARYFKPTLYLDEQNSELPYVMPDSYAVPPYSYESGYNHGLPSDIISNGTVYVRVRPFGVVEPGKAHYIEIAYWFYYSFSRAECTNGDLADHGHDWEHIALCLTKPPDSDILQVVGVFFAQHEGWETLGKDEVQWSGTPGLSSVKVFIVDGSHASYPSTGERCTGWFAECVCHENANG